MIDKYKPAEIEPKWQQKWEADGLHHSDIDHSRPKYYALTMLPYPSGICTSGTGTQCRRRTRAPAICA